MKFILPEKKKNYLCERKHYWVINSALESGNHTFSRMKKTRKVAIFASGSGTNAENIIRKFSVKHPEVYFEIFTNKADAGVIERAKKLNVPCTVFAKAYFQGEMPQKLKEAGFELIVLAGFLWLVPPSFIDEFPRKIINIHPALLPDYGGKGMYGDRVFRLIIKNEEKNAGITIHYVNEEYDKGDVIFQASEKLDENETFETLKKRIHNLEYTWYPRMVEKMLFGDYSLD
jgi:phosphoribosylglycinamide formyltransferase-1